MAVMRGRARKSKLRVNPMLKKLGRLTKKYREFGRDVKVNFDEPLVLGQRAVLRTNRQLPVQLLVGLHRLYKDEQVRANEILAICNQSIRLDHKSNEKQKVINRSGIRALFEERLKINIQLGGVFPCDPNINRRAQELFEQFYDVHGQPNEAEKQLLAQVGRVNLRDLEQWFTAKKQRLRYFEGLSINKAVQRLHHAKTLHSQMLTKKPPTRH